MKALVTDVFEEWQSFPNWERLVHLMIWSIGLIIVNWPSLEVTIGPFHSDSYTLVFPSVYGVVVNMLVVYGAVVLLKQLVQRPRKLLYHLLMIWVMLSLLEGALDVLYFWVFCEPLSWPLFQEIMWGAFLMNTLLFGVPGLLLGLAKFWRKSLDEQPKLKRICIKDGQTSLFLSITDLWYIEGAGNYAIFHTRERRIMERKSLAQLEKELPVQFERCHKSYIVNRALVESASAKQFTVAGNDIPIGRAYRKKVFR